MEEEQEGGRDRGREEREWKRGRGGREKKNRGEGTEKVLPTFTFPRLHMHELNGTFWWRQTIRGL